MTEIPQPPSENVSVSSSTRSELGFRHPVFLSSISNEFKEQHRGGQTWGQPIVDLGPAVDLGVLSPVPLLQSEGDAREYMYLNSPWSNKRMSSNQTMTWMEPARADKQSSMDTNNPSSRAPALTDRIMNKPCLATIGSEVLSVNGPLVCATWFGTSACHN
jgi:hypothetical protein